MGRRLQCDLFVGRGVTALRSFAIQLSERQLTVIRIQGGQNVHLKRTSCQGYSVWRFWELLTAFCGDCASARAYTELAVKAFARRVEAVTS